MIKVRNVQNIFRGGEERELGRGGCGVGLYFREEVWKYKRQMEEDKTGKGVLN